MTHDPSIVMIVDDDDSIRRAVRRLMKSLGLAVEKPFASAEEFLGSERLEQTSCLILDVHMPGMGRAPIAAASGRVQPCNSDHFPSRLFNRRSGRASRR